jgi:hypothetical protein
MEEKILKLSEYIKSIQFPKDGNIVYIEILLPLNWKTFEENLVKIVKGEVEGDKVSYYVYSESNNDISRLLNYVDKVVKLNKELEEKKKLLIGKINELKEIFNEKSLEELRNIKFVIEDNIDLDITTDGDNSLMVDSSNLNEDIIDNKEKGEENGDNIINNEKTNVEDV